MRGELPAFALGLLLLVGLGLYVATSLAVSTDVAQFLPDGEAAADAHLARQLATGELGRTMVLLVDAGDGEAALRGGRAFEAALRRELDGQLAFLDGGPPAELEQAIWELYTPHRFAFLAEDAAAARARLQPEALAAALAHLKRRLQLPLSSLLSRVAPGDPLLILPGLFERLQRGRAEGLRIADGRFVTADGEAAVLFLGTRAAATDGSAQARVLAGIDAAFASANAECGGGLRLLASGANRYAARAEAAIRADIERTGIGSTIGLVLLFVLLFGSLRLPLMALPVLAGGLLGGTAACLLLWGDVHGLTLAFGAALLGVSVDYAVHFQCHWLLAPAATPRRTLAGIAPGLLLSGGTTVAGFAAMLVSSFPGLRQLAVFAAAGIATALLLSLLLLPALAPRTPRVPRIGGALARALARLLSPRRRWPLLLPAALAAVVAAVGLPQLRWNDSLAAMRAPDPDLAAEDAAVRARVAPYEQRRLVVAVGADDEAALQANDAAARALAQAVQRGELAGFRSLADLLPSARRQREVDAAVRTEPELWPRLQTALQQQGFAAAAFQPFATALQAAPPPPLTHAQLSDSPLQPLLRPFHVQLDDGVAIVTFLQGVRDEPALRGALQQVPGARLLDVEQALGAAYGAYRQRLASLLLVGLGAVFALVLLRHRALRPALAACLPALLAAAATAGALACAGVPLDLLALVALLMVVGMGVDYGVFLNEHLDDGPRLQATLLAVAVAAVTTMLGFALLMLSSQPPLQSIARCACLGMLGCLVLAPTLGAAVRRSPP